MADSFPVEWRPLFAAPSAPRRRASYGSPHPAHGASNQVEMVSFGVDPQWGGLLFSLCSRHEDAGAALGAGGGVVLPNVLADPLAVSSTLPGAGGDFVNILGSGCLDLQAVSVSSVWAIIVETAKTTGMVVLLGVGSLLFYRVFHSIRSRLHGLKSTTPGRPSRRPSPATRSSSSRPLASSGEDSDGETSGEEAATCGFDILAEDVEVTGMYFGPGSAAPSAATESPQDVGRGSLVGEGGPCHPARAGASAGKAAAMRRARRLSRRWESGVVSMDDEARDADVSEGSRSPRTPPEERSVAWRGGVRGGGWRGPALCRRPGWRAPPTRGSSTPCSTRSTSSSSSLSPEYPPNNTNNESPSRRRYRRLRQEALALSREDSADGSSPADPREALMRLGLRRLPAGLPREDSADSLARRFMARDESYESLFACQQGTYSRRSLSRNPSTDSLACSATALRAPRLPRNESLDSLGFPRHALARGSSFDSTCSELSLDVSLIAEAEGAGKEGGATLEQLEELQREIEQLKSNCLSLDEELVTVRCNRNLPGMSSLLEVKEPRAGADRQEQAEVERARACFAGLYSLTRIASSPSLDLDQDLSDWDHNQPASINLDVPGSDRVAGSLSLDLQALPLPPTLNEDILTSLEWDEEDISLPDPDMEDSGLANDLVLGACAANISPGHESNNKISERSLQYRQYSLETSCPSLRDSDSMLTSSLATFELDVDSDSVALIPELDRQGHDGCVLTQKTNVQDHLNLSLGERSKENNKQQQDSNAHSPLSPESWRFAEGALTHSSSSSGVSVLSRSLSGLSDVWCSSTAMSPATPASTTHIAVGQRVEIHEYVLKEWQGDTKKAQIIIKGYAEIPGLLGLNAIRVIRGDNYCAVRGAIFQALTHNIPLPSGQLAASRCSQLMSDPSGHCLRSWNFAGRLPYAGDNVENGIRDCLLSIDSTVERLQSAVDKESALANILNNDPWLDARLCEAAKLLMLFSAFELKAAADRGQPLPLFAELLFARDTSSTPVDLMNNHLKHVGDTAGLEQVEMFLLGYALGIRIRVVRPSAFGSQDYVCSYPDPQDIGIDMSEGIINRKLVNLLAEDDRHYNVLVA